MHPPMVQHCGGIPIFLVGNKLDLLEVSLLCRYTFTVVVSVKKALILVSPPPPNQSDMPFSANERLEKLSQDLGFDKSYTTSAKVGLNVEEALTDLLAQILEPTNSVVTVKSEIVVDDGAFQLSSLHGPKVGNKVANDIMPCCLG